jgi:glyoxylase-like metal-dependent hydrolase (beta-lactamase superfamily II)
MRVMQLAVGGFDHNFSYLVADPDGEAVLIDPTGDLEVLRFAWLNARPRVRYILVTHGHGDHVERLAEAREAFPDAEVCGHPGNRYVTRKLADGEVLAVGSGSIETLYTPGHSRDSACFLADGEALFTGDTLFMDYVGFARKPETLYSSLRRIAKLDGGITIYPGHDYGNVPHRSLAEEKRVNRFLNCPTSDEFKNQLKDMD